MRKENIKCQSTKRNGKKRIRKSKNSFFEKNESFGNKFDHSKNVFYSMIKLTNGCNLTEKLIVGTHSTYVGKILTAEQSPEEPLARNLLTISRMKTLGTLLKF